MHISLCILIIFHAIFCANVITARRHHLEVQDDVRPYIALSTFGFYTDGRLSVELSNMQIDNVSANDLFGLTLDKTTIDQMNPYLDSHQNKCLIEEPSNVQLNGQILFFLFDLIKLRVKVQCSPDWHNQNIFEDKNHYERSRHSMPKLSDSSLFKLRRRRDIAPVDTNDDLPVDPMLSDEEAFMVPEDIINKQTSQAPTVGKAADEEKTPQKTSGVEATVPQKDLKEEDNLANQFEETKPTIDLKANDNLKATISGKTEYKDILTRKIEESIPKIDAKSKQVPKDTERVSIPDDDFKIKNVSQNNYYLSKNHVCQNFELKLGKKIVNNQTFYNMSFYMVVKNLHDEGLYNLYFHACPNYRIESEKKVSFIVDIEEKNNENFLSAGEMPLPALYFMMSILFFLSGLFWVFLLKKSKYNVSKIHYIMAVLVFLKSLSLMFHAINFHFIEIRGEHVEAWAILYYITHLLKGAVLFITIVLIGTGWTFIKHILSDKDKKIFMIVIPLQVLANVAEIIIDESEESDIEFRTWRNIFIFVDLICCGAILFPIVWSIRHLHEASATDGKAAINLRKLKLFRQFYIMIVCYIYFSRIIVFLLKMTVAFQYAWVDEMFHELATYVFFVLTGYKFRPESSQAYFTVPDDDDDDEVEVLTESGLTEGLHRTRAQNRNAPISKTKLIEGDDEEREILMIKRESSHEYD